MSDAYGLLAHYGVFGPAEVWTKAAASATAAVMLDANSAEAHTSLAHVKSTQDWDWAGAEREFQRAISLDPRCATSHHWYAMSCLAPLGRLDEALDEMSVAQALDPVSSIVARDLAVIHFYRRDFETALEQCDHTIELNPHFAPAYWILGVIQEQRKDFDESAAAFQRAVHLSPQTPRMHGALGRTFALSGRKKQALEVLRKLETYAKERYVSPLEFAWIQFALGETDLGFRWMQKALEDRSFDLISIKVDPRFDPLKDDPRFETIARRMGWSRPVQWHHPSVRRRRDRWRRRRAIATRASAAVAAASAAAMTRLAVGRSINAGNPLFRDLRRPEPAEGRRRLCSCRLTRGGRKKGERDTPRSICRMMVSPGTVRSARLSECEQVIGLIVLCQQVPAEISP